MKQSVPVESERQQNDRQQGGQSDLSSVSETIVDNRQSTAQMRQLITAMKNAPQVIAQRQLSKQIQNSPHMIAQRQQYESDQTVMTDENSHRLFKRNPAGHMFNSPIQRQKTKVSGNKKQIHSPRPTGSTGTAPAQLMKFERFTWMAMPWNWNWKYNDEERILIQSESRVRSRLQDLAAYQNGVYHDEINEMQTRFDVISNGTYAEANYGDLWEELGLMYMRANTLGSMIERAGPLDEHLSTAITRRQGGAQVTALVSIILKTFAQLPEPLKIAKNKSLLKEALYPEVLMADGFDYRDVDAPMVQYANDRSVVLVEKLTNLHNRVVSDWEGISQTFNLGGDLQEIELTGSDFHNEGQQVAIIVSSAGDRAVYKPRSTSPDRSLIGEGGSMFQYFNFLGEGSVQLPTMKFEEKEDDAGSYSYVAYQQKHQIKTHSQVKTYYERFGEIVVAAKLLGVNDLHNENIMSTTTTPTIIDAETAFLPFVMEAQSLARTEIGMGLKNFKKMMGTEATETFFYTQAEKDAYDLNPVTPWTQHVQNIRQNDLNGAKTYLPDFKKGLDNMLELVQKKKEIIMLLMLKKIETVKNIRVVPFKTQDFQDSIRTYRGLKNSGRIADANSVVTRDVTKMKEAIKAKGFSIVSSDWADRINSKVGVRLKRDYDAGDTPILHFQPLTNTLYFHDSDVGFSESWEEPEELIKRTVLKIANMKKSKIMTDLGVDT